MPWRWQNKICRQSWSLFLLIFKKEIILCYFLVFLLDKNRTIMLNMMWAKNKSIFNIDNMLVLLFHRCVFTFFIRLTCSAVDCQRVEFSMFCQIVKYYLLVTFFWSWLKDIIWPIFFFNWIFFENFMKYFRKCETPWGIRESGLESTGSENYDSSWVNRLSHLTSINLIFLICKTKLAVLTYFTVQVGGSRKYWD